MLGPVSDTGRAMMASLQQAIQKGMPIEQAITYVKSMATQGVAPMVDLYSMLNQFQRLKQPVAQPPQGGTVRDQIAMAAAQRDQQEMMQRGLASMPAQRAPESPMEQGLGSVPAPAMENAQFAGGGIVAFDGGGFITKPEPNPKDDPLYPEQTLQKLREQAGLYEPYEMAAVDKFRYLGLPSDAPSTPVTDQEADREFINAYISRVAKDPAAIGAGLGALIGGPVGIPVGGYLGGYLGRVIGKADGGVIKMAGGTPQGVRAPQSQIDYTNPMSVLRSITPDLQMDPTEYMVREAKAQEEAYQRMGLGAASKARGEEVARQQAEAEKYSDTAARGNLAQYFFDLAANAAKPGARFLSSAALAAPGYGQRRTDIEEKARGLKNAARESQLKLLEAEELRKAGYLGDAAKKRLEARNQAIQTGMEIYKTDNQLKVARIYKDPTGVEALILEQAKIIANNPIGSEAYNQAKDRLDILDKSRAVAKEKLSFAQKLDKARTYRQQIKGLQDQLNKPFGLSAEKKKEIGARIEQLREEAFSLYDIDPRDLEETRNVYGTTLENPLAPQQNVLTQTTRPTAGPVNTPRLSDPLGIR